MHNASERGNVLFLVLIAVMLFGALTFAATNSSRFTGNMDSDSETSRMDSADMSQYAAFIEGSISRMTAVGGCATSSISFERAPFDGSDPDYVNLSAPTDFSCHVFHPAGGAVSDRLFDGKKFDFSGARYIVEVGTTIGNPSDIADLYAMIVVNRNTCLEINENYDVNNVLDTPPVLDGFGDDDLFSGTFDGTESVNASASATHGKRDFCGSVGAEYRYIHVLLPR